MFHHKFGRKLAMTLIGGLAALGMLLGAVAPALAQSATPPAPDPTRQAERDGRLKDWYQREQTWLSTQQDHLNRLNEQAAKAQQWIDDLKSQGQDTSELEAALGTFNSQIATATAAHNTAADILGTHAGFDTDGNVTDPEQARQTLVSTRQSLADAHRLILQARHDFLEAVRNFRKQRFETNALPRLQKWLDVQATHLTRANEAANKVQDWIDQLQSQGKDVTPLVSALDTFKSQLATAQASHDTAASLLATHAGFDENGHVIDDSQAQATIRAARQALADAHTVLRQAERDLRQAIHDYRQTNQ